jgi:hypothetical protein
MEIKFNNPFAKKQQELRDAAAGSCKGCGETLPTMSSENTIRTWCSRPKRIECRKLYHKARRNA